MFSFLLLLGIWVLANLVTMFAVILGTNPKPTVNAKELLIGAFIFLPFAIAAVVVLNLQARKLKKIYGSAKAGQVVDDGGLEDADNHGDDIVVVNGLNIPVGIETSDIGFKVYSIDYPQVFGQGVSVTAAKYDFYTSYRAWVGEKNFLFEHCVDPNF